MDGWLILDKPLGLGSTQAVSAVKRALREGGYPKVKVGHGGTLDPLATGVLPIALGEATKLAGRLLDGDKAYSFTIRFGEQTDTLDAEGRVIATSDVRPTRAAVEATLERFMGPIEQTPPAYSALKVNGERAYNLARSGADVTLATRNVVISRLMSLTFLPQRSESGLPMREPANFSDAAQLLIERRRAGETGKHERVAEATLAARVSKGTYIRSLARDIALALGTVGHVTMLRRTEAGPFNLAHAVSLDNLTQAGTARDLENLLLPLRAGLDDIPALPLTPDQVGALRQGRVLVGIDAADGVTLATFHDVPQALVEITAGTVRVIRGFNL